MGLIASLGLGVIVAIVIFLVAYNVFKLGSIKSGALSALLVLAAYIPLSILSWPGGDVFSIHIAIYGVVPYMLGMVTHYREQALTKHERKTWFHWIPALFVVFFIIVVSVNMILVSFAEKGMSSDLLQWLLPKKSDVDQHQQLTSQFPGVIAHDYQKKESLYNDYLAQIAKQKARGWQFEHGWLVSPVVGKQAVFQVEARDKNGHVLTGLMINLEFLRPSNYKLDQKFNMQEIAEGIYQQQVIFEQPGRWDVLLQMRKGDELHEIRGDISVKE